MSSQIKIFGQLADGSDVSEISLNVDGQVLRVLTWGAVIRDLQVSVGEFENRRVVLGLNTLDDYLNRSPHFGAIAGRYANRIANGRFELDGASHQLTKNQNDLHHLHGGRNGFGKRNWTLIDHGASFVTLRIKSDDGDEGYPGDVTAECTYSLDVSDGSVSLVVSLSATTTKPTLLNLAQHSYFNLDGGGSTRSHKLQILADAYLPTDDTFIPTGEIKSVDGNEFDFRKVRTIAVNTAQTYDNNFIVAEQKRTAPTRIATLAGSDGLSMDVVSAEPGLQFYDGARIDVPVEGLSGHPYGAFAGVCLEPQIWPDSPNHPNFPQAVLRPGETYRQQTSYIFRAS